MTGIRARRRAASEQRIFEAAWRLMATVGPGAPHCVTLGSVLWGPHLRAALGLSERSGIEAAVADVVRWFLDEFPAR